MTVDYSSEMSSVLEDHIPEWFYLLPQEDRVTISDQALVEYTEKTAIKNAAFIVFWDNLIAPYGGVTPLPTPNEVKPHLERSLETPSGILPVSDFELTTEEIEMIKMIRSRFGMR
jgi:hypothetical protein